MTQSPLGLFVGQLIKNPQQIVALAPSSRALCEEMVAGLDPEGGPVIELGAGTGHITRAILDTGLPSEHCHAIEMNPAFCAHLRAAFPGINVHAMNAGDCGALPVTNAQAVISGLPLLSMPVGLQRDILTGFTRLVRPSGHFAQFTYGPKPPVARAVSAALGLEWTASHKIWRNVPPARVYRFRQIAP